SYAGAPSSRRYRIVVHGLASAHCATVDGTAAPVRTSEHAAITLGSGSAWTPGVHGGLLTVVVPPTPVDRAITIAMASCSRPATRRYEAEDATTTGTVARKPDASGGGYVGGLVDAGRH